MRKQSRTNNFPTNEDDDPLAMLAEIGDYSGIMRIWIKMKNPRLFLSHGDKQEIHAHDCGASTLAYWSTISTDRNLSQDHEEQRRLIFIFARAMLRVHRRLMTLFLAMLARFARNGQAGGSGHDFICHESLSEQKQFKPPRYLEARFITTVVHPGFRRRPCSGLSANAGAA